MQPYIAKRSPIFIPNWCVSQVQYVPSMVILYAVRDILCYFSNNVLLTLHLHNTGTIRGLRHFWNTKHLGTKI